MCPVGGAHTSTGCSNGQCTLTCSSSGFADCNGDLLGDGCEQPISSDPLNRGACAHSCLPGGPDSEIVQAAKAAGAVPVVLASSLVSPVGLVGAGNDVVWIEKGHSG